MSTATPAHPGWHLRAQETTAPQPRPVTGPVLMADIMVQYGDRPSLLVLWDRWERAARSGDDAP